jgi:hypothetical protein
MRSETSGFRSHRVDAGPPRFRSPWLRALTALAGLSAALVMPIVGASVLAGPAAASSVVTCGHVDLHRYDWLAGQGVAVHNAVGCPGGVLDYVGAVPAGYEWQCVELVNRLYLKRGWITSNWHGNGNQLYANAPSGLVKQPQGSITQLRPGDVVSLDNKSTLYGHSAVVDTVTANPAGGYDVVIVNQNTSNVFSYATLSAGRLTMVGWTGWTIIGVVHAPKS